VVPGRRTAHRAPLDKELIVVDFKVEIVVLPVSDVDRAKAFYEKAFGVPVDVDYAGPNGFRIVHLTPTGSLASLVFGSGITDETPGTSAAVHLVVDDVVAARKELEARGVEVSEVFHDAGGVFHHSGTTDRVPGPQPERRSYGSWFSFADPDGNELFVQEVTTRGAGRVRHVIYRSADELEAALRDAAEAHGRHEADLGHPDADWPSWYAAHMAQRAGLAD
jgi:catechol 2,3-dioxygenase-like lactoylglutathione lyase family enzyme